MQNDHAMITIIFLDILDFCFITAIPAYHRRLDIESQGINRGGYRLETAGLMMIIMVVIPRIISIVCELIKSWEFRPVHMYAKKPRSKTSK